MTHQRAKELLPVITAFANGETIQCSATNWKTHEDITSDHDPKFYDDMEYRIKPKPVTRPWNKPEDVPGPVCWIRGDGIKGLMVMAFDWNGSGLTAGHSSYSWREIANRKLEHSTDRKTWHPCTVTEEAP